MAPVVQLEEIWKTYRSGDIEVHAVRGVSLIINAGEFVALMGASGSGKSTLMNTLGCLDHPTAGRYVLDGIDVSQLDRNARADNAERDRHEARAERDAPVLEERRVEVQQRFAAVGARVVRERADHEQGDQPEAGHLRAACESARVLDGQLQVVVDEADRGDACRQHEAEQDVRVVEATPEQHGHEQ